LEIYCRIESVGYFKLPKIARGTYASEITMTRKNSCLLLHNLIGSIKLLKSIFEQGSFKAEAHQEH
jgi:hypothetical protein